MFTLGTTGICRIDQVENNTNPFLLHLKVQNDIDLEYSLGVYSNQIAYVQAFFDKGESLQLIPIYLNNFTQLGSVEISAEEDRASFFDLIDGLDIDQNDSNPNIGYDTNIPVHQFCIDQSNRAICDKISADPRNF